MHKMFTNSKKKTEFRELLLLDDYFLTGPHRGGGVGGANGGILSLASGRPDVGRNLPGDKRMSIRTINTASMARF
jgi:hypothetical protein